jgi:hypothetical protein
LPYASSIQLTASGFINQQSNASVTTDITRRRRRRSCLGSGIMHFHPSSRRLFNIIDIINM